MNEKQIVKVDEIDRLFVFDLYNMDNIIMNFFVIEYDILIELHNLFEFKV